MAGVNTWQVEQGAGQGGARVATVTIGWEKDPAKDPTEYVGKPIRDKVVPLDA